MTPHAITAPCAAGCRRAAVQAVQIPACGETSAHRQAGNAIPGEIGNIIATVTASRPGFDDPFTRESSIFTVKFAAPKNFLQALRLKIDQTGCKIAET